MKSMSPYAEMTKDEAIKAILADTGIPCNDKVIKAMDTALREGWYRCEEYMSEQQQTVTTDTDKLQTIINSLMANDHNASWDECETLEEVAEGLRNAMEDYDETEETYQFYASILSQIEGHE